MTDDGLHSEAQGALYTLPTRFINGLQNMRISSLLKKIPPCIQTISTIVILIAIMVAKMPRSFAEFLAFTFVFLSFCGIGAFTAPGTRFAPSCRFSCIHDVIICACAA